MNDVTEAVIHPGATIAATAIISKPYRPLLDGRTLRVGGATEVHEGAWVGEFTTIGQGATIGAGSMIEDYASIGPGSTIGSGVVVTSRSTVAVGATVGDDSVINGFVCDFAKVGRGCKMAGELIHRSIDPTPGWDDPTAEEPAPQIGDGAFVGWRAVIIGGVNIGKGAYVCAGALVSRDVPAGHIAFGRNEIVRPSAWPGDLHKSPFFGQQRGT